MNVCVTALQASHQTSYLILEAVLSGAVNVRPYYRWGRLEREPVYSLPDKTEWQNWNMDQGPLNSKFSDYTVLPFI
jgi:hypothetical protein